MQADPFETAMRPLVATMNVSEFNAGIDKLTVLGPPFLVAIQ